MEKSSVEVIVKTLIEHQVRYLIAGGLAVAAHGYVRFTADVDLILATDEANLKRAVAALESLDYRSRAPVEFSEFIDPRNRQQWAGDKHMIVFSLYSPRHPATEIDLFLEPPLDFEKAYAAAANIELAPNVRGSFCSLNDLISLKEKGGRPQDLRDIAQLRRLQQENRNERT
jgi:hypothetical protein